MKFCLSLLAALLLTAPVLAATPITQAQTTSGTVQGGFDGAVLSWKGIPFAAPPVGDLRWRAPQPAPAWSGIRDASTYAHDCAQNLFPGDMAPLQTTPSEDCLYLNIWRPLHGTHLPVMVWIYGGGNVNGGTSPAVYNGASLARHGVVLVSFNYRLGRFGFFAFPALTTQHAGEPKGNYGNLDQIAALHWVQANIANFGGDPGNVTVFGKSAGGAAVHVLLATPLAKGLFARAVIESGGGRGSLMGHMPLPAAEQIGVAFAAKHGITGIGAEALARLRALPADQVVDGLNMANLNGNPTYSGAIYNGKILQGAPDAAYASGNFNQVPVLVGANTADLGFLTANSKDELFASFGAHAQQARNAYDPHNSASLATLITQVAADRTMIEPATHVAQLISAHQPVYLYRFGYRPLSTLPQWAAGAPHASEIPYVFGTLAATHYIPRVTAADQAVSTQLETMWLRFAKTGNPGWSRFDPSRNNLMLINERGQARTLPDPWRARMEVTASVAK